MNMIYIYLWKIIWRVRNGENVCSEYDEIMIWLLFFVILVFCILKLMDRRLFKYVKKVVMEYGVMIILKMKLLF